MDKKRVVVFPIVGDPRILVNPPEEAYIDDPRALVNPDMTTVDGIPPHYWKCIDGQIMPMNADECATRDRAVFPKIVPFAARVKMTRYNIKDLSYIASFAFVAGFVVLMTLIHFKILRMGQ